MLKSLLREPLIYFSLFGAILFIANDYLNTEDIARISVSQNDIDAFSIDFQSRYSRLPEKSEINEFKSNWLKEEVLYREGKALGLDKNDPVIRNRIVKKMQLLLANENNIGEPSDTQLKTFMQENSHLYTQKAEYGLSVVILTSPDLPKDVSEQEYATLVLSALNNGAELSQVGLPHRNLSNQNPATISAIFGQEFLSSLEKTVDSGLYNLISSTKGPTLVKVLSYQPEKLADFEKVRERVITDWKKAQRVKYIDEQLEKLQNQYVTIQLTPKLACYCVKKWSFTDVKSHFSPCTNPILAQSEQLQS